MTRQDTIDAWFDYACPRSYLLSERIEDVAARAGARVAWHPVDAAALRGPSGVTVCPSKAEYLRSDLERRARTLGIPLLVRDAVPDVRGALAATRAAGCPAAMVHAIFRALWRDGSGSIPQIVTDDDNSTDEAVARGVFDVPTVRVGDELFFGEDRLHFVEAALGLPRQEPPRLDPPLDFWFDFSSPFAYLASTRVGPSARWRPMLLGAVFRAVGQADVPLFAMEEARRRHTLADLERWASWWSVPFRMPSRFPIRSVLSLRVFLAHPEPVAFARAVYRAVWAEDLDISDPRVLEACGAGDALDRAEAMREALRASTDAALAAGVFGAPSFVTSEGLFWGQDRLGMVG